MITIEELEQELSDALDEEGADWLAAMVEELGDGDEEDGEQIAHAMSANELLFDFTQAKKKLDATEDSSRQRLQEYLIQLQDSVISQVEAIGPALTSEQVKDFKVATADGFATALSDMMELGWNHGRDAGVIELPAKVRKEPAVVSVKTFKVDDWAFQPHWATFAEWDESKHPRHDKGSDKGGEFASSYGTADQFAELMKSPYKMIDFINDIVGEDFSGSVGLRGLYSDEKLGPLPPSKVWDDGDQTDEEMRGTSTLGIGDWNFTADETIAKNITNAVKDIWRYGDGDVGLVVGGDSGGGEDKNELVIQDAKVVYIWRKAKNKSRPFDVDDAKYSKDYANAFEPTEALAAFGNRAWLIKDVVDSNLRAQIRYELFEHLKGGRTLRETQDNIRDILAPWVGDTSKLKPGSEDILSAHRLENIIRTETTWAYNQGRLATGDASNGYVIGYELSAVLDERTTEICNTADGLKMKVDAPTTIKLTPPLHYQCRSVLTFITKDDVPVKWSSARQINKALELVSAGFK